MYQRELKQVVYWKMENRRSWIQYKAPNLEEVDWWNSLLNTVVL